MAAVALESFDLGLATSFIEATPDAVVIVDKDGVIVAVNCATEKLFGYLREDLLGHPVEILIAEHSHVMHRVHRSKYTDDPHTRRIGEGVDTRGLRSDGTEFSAEISLSPLTSPTGVLFSSIICDVSERRRLEAQASHFQSVVEFSQDAIISKDLDGIIVSWNAGAQRLYGYSSEEVVGKSISFLVPIHHENELPDILRRVKSGEVIENHETVRARKDGTLVNVSLTVSPIRTSDGRVTGASAIARNITERLRYQEQLVALSERDALTGLRNRRRFERDIADQVGRAHRYDECAVLMMIDLNGFKSINDVHGHRAGDQVLKSVATALMGRLRDTDLVARIGGDEFAIVMPYARLDTAESIAESLRELIRDCALNMPGASKLHLTASIGLVEINKETVGEEEIIAEADRLMYKEKKLT